MDWLPAKCDPLEGQVDDFYDEFSRAHVNPRQGDRQPEPPWARASWIQVDDAVALLLSRSMRMTADYNAKADYSRIEVQFVDVVKNIDSSAACLDLGRFG